MAEPVSDLTVGDESHHPSKPPISKHYSREYAALVGTYEGDPIDISFRELVGPLPASEYTHGLFPYPARLLRHIPRFLLAADAVVAEIDTVFDPFVGSGTVLLEAQLRGFASIGVEQNPVAALVSRVKVSRASHRNAGGLLSSALAVAKRRRSALVPSPMLTRWYSGGALSALGRLAATAAEGDEQDRDLVHLCLALTARRMATTDPRIPVPVRSARNGAAGPAEVWRQWETESAAVLAKLLTLPARRPMADVRLGDARDLTMWPEPQQAPGTLLLTSPPYGAAQKYIRSTSLEAAWLGHVPKGRTVHLEHSSIGREHLSSGDMELNSAHVTSRQLRQDLTAITAKDARRGAIYVAYFTDMQRVFMNAQSVGIRRIALVSGDNQVAGGVLKTSQHLADIIESLGYTRTVSLRDPIRGRTLLTSRRNGSPAPAEYIEIFERTP